MIEPFYFKQFNLALVICLHSVKISNSSISPVDKTLSGAITPSQSGPISDCNEGVLNIPQCSGITGASLPGCLVSYPRLSLVERVLSICRDAVGVF